MSKKLTFKQEAKLILRDVVFPLFTMMAIFFTPLWIAIALNELYKVIQNEIFEKLFF